MNLLFDPNLAYILLVVGTILLMLAIITPGTGLLEVGAFFLLVLAGYAILNIGFNLWAPIVLLLALIPFLYAVRKPKREWALAVSLVAVVAGSVYMFPGKGLIPEVDPILAFAVSALAFGFLWLVIRKTVQAHNTRPTHDLQALIGQIGEAKTPVHEDGSVQVAGELWSARSGKPIPAGSRVRVLSREGFVLVVAPEDQSKK